MAKQDRGPRTNRTPSPRTGKRPVEGRQGFPRGEQRPPRAGGRRPSRPYSEPAEHGPEFTPRDPDDIGLGVRLVYQDDDVVVVDKPVGLVTAPMPGTPEHENPELRERSVFGVVKRLVKDQRRQRGTRVWIIHRLDKEATGLLVFAASDRAYEQLKEEFRTKRAHRLYMAVVEGEILTESPALPGRTAQPASGIIRSMMAEGPDGLMRSVKEPRRGSHADPGQNAVTHWRVVATGGGRSLVQLRLDTGRKNQIRVHMREMNHPLVGDLRYGGRSNPIARLCLHATELGFSHPATGQDVRFFSPPPQAFYGLVNQMPPENSLPGSKPTIVGEAPAVPRLASPAGRDGAATGRRDDSDTSWDHVAEWYDRLIDERRSDHHEKVILPGVLRLLKPAAEMKVLDLACGQGDFCRRLGALGVHATGVDASPRLIEAARSVRGTPEDAGAPVALRFIVGDARELGSIAEFAAEPGARFSAVTSIMALMNMDPLDPVLRGIAGLLEDGGAFIFVILHPAFRAPGQTSWGWDGERHQGTQASRHQGRGHRASEGRGSGGERQYRRVDGYLSPGQTPIVMNPGKAAHGAEPVTTWTFHRPIQAYAKVLNESGFVIEMIEEWPSARRSAPGPRAAEENRARREIPMFLAVRARKASAGLTSQG